MNESKSTAKSLNLDHLFYLIVIQLVIYFAASFYPGLRLFGFAIWSHFHIAGMIALALTSVILSQIALKSIPSNKLSRQKSKRSYFYQWSLLIVVLTTLLFVVGRSQTHFLGDGYTVLANYALEEPIIKIRELGESLVHLWVRDLVGGFNENSSLIAFRLISIGSGIVYLLLSLWTAAKLYKAESDRLLFFGSMITGGFMLLFFGYVELYSLFVCSVWLFCVTGLLITRLQYSRWLILLPTVLASFFHIMGVILLPAAAYIILYNSPLGKKMNAASNLTKIVVAAVIAAAGIAAFGYFYITNLFFRFAILPPLESRFAIDGYTMFSLDHFIDMINQLMLILPALPIFLFFLIKSDIGIKYLRSRSFLFLAIATLSGVFALLIFDPKLGMARDWDLFSFIAVPFTALMITSVLDSNLSPRLKQGVVVFIIIISTTVLASRVITQNLPTIAIERVKDYMAIDKTRNRLNWFILAEYYRKNGDTNEANNIRQHWRNVHPEQVIVEEANALSKEGKFTEALELSKKAIALNPMLHESYASLGSCYLILDSNELALENLLIATGLNPHKPSAHTNLGSAYYRLERYEEAEKAWMHALSLDDSFIPLLNLSRLYGKTGQIKKQREYLLKASEKPDVPAHAIAELSEFYISQNEWPDARQALEHAMRLGLDSARVMQIINDNENFRRYLEGGKIE